MDAPTSPLPNFQQVFSDEMREALKKAVVDAVQDGLPKPNTHKDTDVPPTKTTMLHLKTEKLESELLHSVSEAVPLLVKRVSNSLEIHYVRRPQNGRKAM